MKLSENFTLEELICSATADHRKIQNVPDSTHIYNLSRLCSAILQPVRNKFGDPIKVTSGFRCEALNKIVGGASTSQHLRGEAADIVCQDNRKLWQTILGMIESGELVVGQLIDEKNLRWIHISLPTSKHQNQVLKL